jgi:hypothetical protein
LHSPNILVWAFFFGLISHCHPEGARDPSLSKGSDQRISARNDETELDFDQAEILTSRLKTGARQDDT